MTDEPTTDGRGSDGQSPAEPNTTEPNTAEPNTAERDPEDVRLVEAACRVFAARGIKSTSIDDIAAEAGVTRVTVYRRLGPREAILREMYAHETQRLMMSVNDRFTPFESLDWDPVRHVEDLLVGVVFDIRHSELLRRLIEVDRVEAMTMLASQSDSVLGSITELVSEFIRNTWDADIHSRPMDEEEKQDLSREIGAVLGRYLHSLVVMPDGPPLVEDEAEIRALARRTLVPMVLQR